MEKPKLKTPPQPKIVYMDLDAVLFAAASAGEQINYVAKTPEGEEVARFKSASEYKNWLATCEEFGIDMDFGFEGDFETLERHTEYEIKEFKECKKTFRSMVQTWFERSGCEEMVGYVSKASGEKNFRYAVATVQPYKGSRKESRKPHYLEELRKYVKGLPYMKTSRGSVEVDDVVCALAQRKGWRGCVMGVDKDARGSNNTHVFIPEEMEYPEFSSNKIVGRLYKSNKGKVQGLGTLFWLWQALAGDPVDKIPGCKGVGAEGAFKVLQEFDGVDVKYLPDAVKAVAEEFNKKYGTDYSYVYPHHETGEEIKATGMELFIEMSILVYMKKNQKDECFWIPLIEDLYNE